MADPGNIVVVVDDNDKVIKYINQADFSNDMRRRDTCILIFNDKKQLLLARRHPSKKVLPNKWGPSASGTVESHESYEQNAYKELQEEIGLTNIPLTHIGNYCMDHDSHKRYTGLFTGEWNGSLDALILEENHVAEVAWVSLDELAVRAKNNPDDYVPGLVRLLRHTKQIN